MRGQGRTLRAPWDHGPLGIVRPMRLLTPMCLTCSNICSGGKRAWRGHEVSGLRTQEITYSRERVIGKTDQPPVLPPSRGVEAQPGYFLSPHRLPLSEWICLASEGL